MREWRIWRTRLRKPLWLCSVLGPACSVKGLVRDATTSAYPTQSPGEWEGGQKSGRGSVETSSSGLGDLGTMVKGIRPQDRCDMGASFSRGYGGFGYSASLIPSHFSPRISQGTHSYWSGGLDDTANLLTCKSVEISSMIDYGWEPSLRIHTDVMALLQHGIRRPPPSSIFN